MPECLISDLSEVASLLELLRIPSVSADPGHASDLRDALEWVASFVREGGGEAELVAGATGPLVVGEFPASCGRERAANVLCYGHVDVQPPAPLELWESPPFEPTVRGGWLYCRGVADDKGQFWLLLEAARRLSSEGALPVNVRVLCDAEEEVGGGSTAAWVEQDERGADACIIFDTAMLSGDVPAFCLGTRGTAYFHVTVHTGLTDVHSGVFGGAALNALHSLIAALGEVIALDGRLPEPLRRGVVAPTREETSSWAGLTPGDQILRDQGVVPSDDGAEAGAGFYSRTWSEPALDVHGLAGGSPHLQKTVVPCRAEANLSFRLAHGQTVAVIAPMLEQLLRDATPAGASLQVELLSACDPSLVAPGSPVIKLALGAFERALGIRPVLARTGGSLPIASALAARGIPALITGFDVPEGRIHAPNERFRLDHFRSGLAAARELFGAYAGLR